jgi:ubiquinone biosynthesis UbiH/UbiF/VisC/COQ6 family hydroxylase
MNPVVTISGGGIIGNYISLRLNRNSIESVVIEKSKDKTSAKENIRTVTLNPFSKKLLDDVGIKIPYAEIKKINVFDGEGTGSIDFSSDEINEDHLSYVVYFNDLEAALKKNVFKKTFFETEIKNFKENINNGNCEITLSNEKPIFSTFLAGCDGRNSNVAKITGLPNEYNEYKQTAITFVGHVTNNDSNLIAHQAFSEKGIFALMPMPNKDSNKNRYTIVWSIDNSILKNISPIEYVKSNLSFFESKLGLEIQIDSEILNFKLSNHHFKNYIKDSVVLIGDAAHSIHPLAGQGINLGLADADIFCEEVINAYNKGYEINNKAVLKKYEIKRKGMNLLMLKSMDFFVDFFSSKNLYVMLLRNFGLTSVNKTKFLKAFFMKHASGLNKF